MKMKQKVTMMLAAFALMTGVTSFVLAAAFPSNVALAYTLEEDCGKYSSPGEEAACRAFQEEGADDEGSSGSTAAECTGDDCCGDVKTSIIKGNLCGTDEGKAESSTIFALLKGLLQIMTAGVGIAAVGGIAYGALLYTTAENKPEQTKKAIGIITNVVIGLVAYAFMGLLLNFLIPGGIFG